MLSTSDARALQLLTVLAVCWGSAGQAAAISIDSASCAVQPDNVLRYDCTVVTDLPGRVAIVFSDGTTARSTELSAPRSTAHTFTLWGMTASTSYNWHALATHSPSGNTDVVTGSFTTGSLPSEVALSLTVKLFSRPFTLEHLLFPAGCDSAGQWLVIANSAGQVVWYEDVGNATGTTVGKIDGLNVSREGTILAIAEHDWVLEYDLNGDLLLFLARGTDFTDAVHHDLQRKDGSTYVLTGQIATYGTADFVIDGVNVFDSTGALTTDWDQSAVLSLPTDCAGATGGYWKDVFPSSALPTDCVHTNSLWVDDLLRWTFSLLVPNQVIQVDSSGSLQWTLDGSGAGGDFTIGSSVTTDLTFNGQHHVWFSPAGQLRLFDNDGSNSRALQLELDFTTLPFSATITEEYTTRFSCPTQSSAYRIGHPRGHLLITCAPERLFQEYDATGTVAWQGRVVCDSGNVVGEPYRGIPIDLR